MKKILFLIMYLSTSSVFAQNNLSFSKVITTDSVSKLVLYFKIKEWIGTTFNYAKSVIEMDDKDAGLLIGTGNMEFSYKSLMYAC